MTTSSCSSYGDLSPLSSKCRSISLSSLTGMTGYTDLTGYIDLTGYTEQTTNTLFKSIKTKQKKWKKSLQKKFARLLPTPKSEVEKRNAIKAKFRLNQKNLVERQAKEEKLGRSKFLDATTETANLWVQKMLAEQHQTKTKPEAEKSSSSEVLDMIKAANEFLQEALDVYQANNALVTRQEDTNTPKAPHSKLNAIALLQAALAEYQTNNPTIFMDEDDLEILQCLQAALAELQTGPNYNEKKSLGSGGSHPNSSISPDSPNRPRHDDSDSDSDSEDLDEFSYLIFKPSGSPPPPYSLFPPS
ncbi:hypothetical protein B0T09DRAFT_379159 [Sordaria sp. MPI-SDFR-AT-0083]|nr:hypothetical protein B0T09DRAFT_379159 [Sordaria sp. MPI-SDFR-AT-0083]